MRTIRYAPGLPYGLGLQVAVLILTALIPHRAAAQWADGDQLQRAILSSLLLDDDEGEASLGARSIGKLYPDDVILTDHVAECLLQMTAAPLNQGSIEAIVRLINVISQIRSPRYLDTLQVARTRLSDKRLVLRLDNATMSGMSASAPMGSVPC